MVLNLGAKVADLGIRVMDFGIYIVLFGAKVADVGMDLIRSVNRERQENWTGGIPGQKDDRIDLGMTGEEVKSIFSSALYNTKPDNGSGHPEHDPRNCRHHDGRLHI